MDDFIFIAPKPPKHKQIGHYRLICTIGQGSGGVVKLAEDPQGRCFAIKKFNKFLLRKKRVIEKDSSGNQVFRNALEDVLKEVQVLQKVDHPNVVRLEEVIEKEEKLFLVLEYAQYGQIMEWREEQMRYSLPSPGWFSEETLRLVFRDCLRGMAYLHSQLIMHRDIKPQNILVDRRGITKLCDLGSCKQLAHPGELLQQSIGTYHFMSPESLSGHSPFCGQLSDIWSMGVTFFSLVFGQLPFDGDSLLQLFSNIGQAPLLLPRPVSPELEHLLRAMLDKSPLARPPLPQLLQHPFLNHGLPPLSSSLDSPVHNPALIAHL